MALSDLFRSGPTWIEPAELAAEIEAPSPPLIVDVRSPAEFDGPLGHIAGAANIPLDQFAQRAAEAAAPGRRTILVCHTDRRSSAADKFLRDNGASETAVLRGGMVAWTQAGLPRG